MSAEPQNTNRPDDVALLPGAKCNFGRFERYIVNLGIKTRTHVNTRFWTGLDSERPDIWVRAESKISTPVHDG